MDFDDIIVETRDHICTITFNRPEKLNAFRAQTTVEMRDALDAVDADGGYPLPHPHRSGPQLPPGTTRRSRSPTVRPG